ncbi:MAG: hypothetical protein J1E83_13670 [Lachnospiraceae bacterium]|nr:hypothetical protein [Lachnospiraceae bacterium]
MLNDKYGDLLDRVIYKLDNTTAAMDAINGFNDGMNKRKQAEVDKHNRMESDRVQKNIEEQVRISQQNDFINSMLDRCRQKEDAEDRQRQAERKEREMKEQNRKAAENLRRYDERVAKNKERMKIEQAKAEMDALRKW